MCIRDSYNVFAPFSSLRFGADAIGISDDQVMEYIRTDRTAVMKALDVIAQDVYKRQD